MINTDLDTKIKQKIALFDKHYLLRKKGFFNGQQHCRYFSEKYPL